jgi:CheY-like chemotaxis protein
MSAAILIVDDFEPNRYIRGRMLRQAGYDVVEADSAEGVWDVVQDGPAPSLVLLDVGLPDQDGVSLCRDLKERFPGLPVVMISASHRSATDLRESFGAGADAFLIDPVTPERLLNTVANVLAGKA